MKRSTKGRFSKNKGSSFERWVCRKFSLALSDGQADDWFWRSAMSGGRATVGRKAGLARSHQEGDISSVSAEGQWFVDRFVVECKSYAHLPLLTFMLDPSKTIIAGWWKNLKEAIGEEVDNSDSSNIYGMFARTPLLVMKENGQKPVVLTHHFIDWFLYPNREYQEKAGSSLSRKLSCGGKYIYFGGDTGSSYALYSLDEFLDILQWCYRQYKVVHEKPSDTHE